MREGYIITNSNGIITQNSEFLDYDEIMFESENFALEHLEEVYGKTDGYSIKKCSLGSLKNEKTILEVQANVRYLEDTLLNNKQDLGGDITGMNGNNWDIFIDVEDGKILNWKQGDEARVHYKVCDMGKYFITINSKRLQYDGYYVPDILAIEDEGYGDYIIIDIDKNGYINNFENHFKKHFALSEWN